jgi:hypothetical protein
MSRTDNIGRVIGKDTSGRIIVRVDHRVMAEFGELWIIHDEDQSTRYFARVVDTKYGVDADDISDYAKTLLDHPEMSLDESDRELIGFNFAIVDLLGVIEGGKIADYYRIPAILAEVRKPCDDEFGLIVQ